ncbi:hypothetical protein L6452_37096 [Arctium lappa]|uniref:Uncharacterized protein n=1 Tax=Arctium lappa TaxID=4217 RepID=A0ACB8Y1Z8_ARCLA|nr:hypothetical protein L6452_37096 [Arctium lappa]
MKQKSQWGKIKGENKRINLERNRRHISKGVTRVAGGAGVTGIGFYPYERHRLLVVLRSGDEIDRSGGEQLCVDSDLQRRCIGVCWDKCGVSLQQI